jgi:uracil phosphoribosyltransferase
MEVVHMVKIRPEFKQLLGMIVASKSVGVVVTTCGINSIWRRVLERELPGSNIVVIGSNSTRNGYVVTPETKANLVTILQDNHGIHVCAIGDSLVDVGMLTKADRSFVVVGPEHGRSKSVESTLIKAFKENGHRARQILFPPDSAPRLTEKALPKANFDAASFLAELEKPHGLKFVHATNKTAAKLLAADSRNVDIHGLNLHRVHRKIGWYLATEYVSEMVGVEAFDMVSAQKQTTDGHRLRNESQTCIVPLMRGGEPFARGVWEAFPSAMFLHAKEAKDVQAEHLAGKWTVILVDAVINSGKSVVEFARHIRGKLSRQIRIVIVAGVVQEGAVAETGLLMKGLAGMGDVSLVALRTSENNFSGKGTTNTGRCGRSDRPPIGRDRCHRLLLFRRLLHSSVHPEVHSWHASSCHLRG